MITVTKSPCAIFILSTRTSRLPLDVQFPGAIAPEDGDGEIAGPVVQGHVGAKLEHRKPFFQVVQPRPLAIQKQRIVQADDEKIMQVFSLRRQKRGVYGTLGSYLLNVVGNQALKKGYAVNAPDRQQAAVFEQGIAWELAHGSPFITPWY